MSQSQLQTLLKPAASPRSGLSLGNAGGNGTSALAATPNADFSRALERRLNGNEGAAAHEARAERPRTPEQRPAERPRERSAEAKSPERARERERTASEPAPRPAESTEARGRGPESDCAGEDHAQEPGSDEAAAVAAAMTPLAAGQAAISGGDETALGADDPLAGDAQQPGNHALARLIGDLSRGKGHAAKGAADAGEVAIQGGAPLIAKGDAGQPPGIPVALAALAGSRAETMPQVSTDPAISGLPGMGAPARTEQASMPQLTVPTPAGQRAWAEDVGNRVMWMVSRNDSKAELILTPAHLGKLEISIQMSGEQATAHFVAATSAARDALEQAMPRLREILQQAGISLGQADVSTSGEQQARQGGWERSGRSGRGFAAEGGALDGAQAMPAPAAWSRSGLGMVDTFV